MITSFFTEQYNRLFETKETGEEGHVRVVGKWRVICKMESDDAEIGIYE